MAIANQVTEIVYLDIDMSRSRHVGFSLIIIHDALCSQYFCGLLLRMTKAL
jgi:hypothetical protein